PLRSTPHQTLPGDASCRPLSRLVLIIRIPCRQRFPLWALVHDAALVVQSFVALIFQLQIDRSRRTMNRCGSLPTIRVRVLWLSPSAKKVDIRRWSVSFLTIILYSPWILSSVPKEISMFLNTEVIPRVHRWSLNSYGLSITPVIGIHS